MALNFLRRYISTILRAETWLMEGLELHGGQKLSIAYVGPQTQRSYLAKTAFQDGWTERSLGREWIWFLASRVRRLSPDCALLVYELDAQKEWIAGLSGLLRSPVWLRFELPLDRSHFSAETRGRYRDMERMIRKYGLTSSLSREEADFDDFYHHIYVPFTQKRHGVSALIHPYEELKRWFLASGELVLCRKDGETIAAGMIDYAEPVAAIPYHGVRDGSDEYMKMGVPEGLYVFYIPRIKERTRSAVMSLGHCRAFFNDKTFRYKIRLGAYVAQGHYVASGCLRFRFLKDTDGLRRFLCENPLVRLDEKGRYTAAVFSEKDFSKEGVDQILDGMHCKGLKEFSVYVFERTKEETVQTPGGRNIRFLPVSGLSSVFSARTAGSK